MNNDIQNHGGSEFSAQSRLNSKNVILVDADYVDKVAFNLIVNFERMIGRRIPQADMAKWIDCVALDGGIREGEHETQVVLIHSKEKIRMENFAPGNYEEELTGKAFKDHLGEFVINAYPTEDVVSGEQQFIDTLQTICDQKEVKRVMVIPNTENLNIYNKVRETLHHVDDDEKRITVFTMQPMVGGNFRQEILGYSLMAALGIRSEELNCK
ncbi:MAG: hypothetical protein J6W43_07260 [Prevotella sp.]|nr:hypothetical protein [Prevotella sp.]